MKYQSMFYNIFMLYHYNNTVIHDLNDSITNKGVSGLSYAEMKKPFVMDLDKIIMILILK
jgi:hypothetical protein